MRKGKFTKRRIVLFSLLFTVAATLLTLQFRQNLRSKTPDHRTIASSSANDLDLAAYVAPERQAGAFRPVYPYSIVPGGVQSSSELKQAAAADPLVAAHYRDLSLSNLRPERVKSDRLVFLSYRVADRIYWTSKPLALHKGEWILTDGKNEIRGRCGNRISEAPASPIAPHEPPEVASEKPVSVVSTGLPTLPSTLDDPEWNSISAMPELIAAVPSPDAPSGGGPYVPFVPPVVSCCSGKPNSPKPPVNPPVPPPIPPPPTPPIATPEPSSLGLLAVGGVALAALAIRRRRAALAARPQ